MLAREEFEALAESWGQQGRPYATLLSGYSLITLRCWSFSEGGKGGRAVDGNRTCSCGGELVG